MWVWKYLKRTRILPEDTERTRFDMVWFDLFGLFGLSFALKIGLVP